MATLPIPTPIPASPTRRSIAQDVARGVTRLFFHQDMFALCEVPLPNGRRADMMAIDGAGIITIVEIKVSRADLIGDRKWTDYLDYCDRFFWAVPAGFDLGAVRSAMLPARPVRPDRRRPLRCGGGCARRRCESSPPARRKAETLRFARRAARRLVGDLDPGPGGLRLGQRLAARIWAGDGPGRRLGASLRAASPSPRRAHPAAHNRAPNSRRRCRSAWDWRPCRAAARTIVMSRLLDGQDERRLAAIVGQDRRWRGGSSSSCAPSTQPSWAARVKRRVAVLVLDVGLGALARAGKPSQVRSRSRTTIWSAPSPLAALAGVDRRSSPARRDQVWTLSPSRSRTALRKV